jgi:hypothetical protein
MLSGEVTLIHSIVSATVTFLSILAPFAILSEKCHSNRLYFQRNSYIPLNSFIICNVIKGSHSNSIFSAKVNSLLNSSVICKVIRGGHYNRHYFERNKKLSFEPLSHLQCYQGEVSLGRNSNLSLSLYPNWNMFQICLCIYYYIIN